jgi:hypothetical protein
MKKYKIELSEEHLSVLNNLLMNAPYRVAAPIINHINIQISKAESPESSTERIEEMLSS